MVELETPDAILVVMAVDDNDSLIEAETILNYLKDKQFLTTQVSKQNKN